MKYALLVERRGGVELSLPRCSERLSGTLQSSAPPPPRALEPGAKTSGRKRRSKATQYG